jgi:hypothetical protein
MIAQMDVPSEQQGEQRAHGVHADPGRKDGHGRERHRIEAARLFIEAQLQVLGHAARPRAVIERHHEDPDEHHRGNGANPVKVARQQAVLGAACSHPDHFLGAEVRRKERQSADPGRNRSARQQKVVSAGNSSAEDEPHRQHEDDVDHQKDHVERSESHLSSQQVCGSSSPAAMTPGSANIRVELAMKVKYSGYVASHREMALRTAAK